MKKILCLLALGAGFGFNSISFCPPRFLKVDNYPIKFNGTLYEESENRKNKVLKMQKGILRVFRTNIKTTEVGDNYIEFSPTKTSVCMAQNLKDKAPELHKIFGRWIEFQITKNLKNKSSIK